MTFLFVVFDTSYSTVTVDVALSSSTKLLGSVQVYIIRVVILHANAKCAFHGSLLSTELATLELLG